jgi:hypothetical protein
MSRNRTILLLIGFGLLAPICAFTQKVELKISKLELSASSIVVSFAVTNNTEKNVYLDQNSIGAVKPSRAFGACYLNRKWMPALAESWDVPALEYLTLRPAAALEGTYILDRRRYPCPLPSKFRLQVPWSSRPGVRSLSHPSKWNTAAVETEIKEN